METKLSMVYKLFRRQSLAILNKKKFFTSTVPLKVNTYFVSVINLLGIVKETYHCRSAAFCFQRIHKSMINQQGVLATEKETRIYTQKRYQVLPPCSLKICFNIDCFKDF